MTSAATTSRPATRHRLAVGRVPKLALIAAIVALPALVAVVSLLGYHWHAASDLGVEVLRIKDVGGRHTPLVGVQSRFGWDHPGPLLFWLLAPFDWLFGETGILVGTALLNAAALVGALAVARRRGGIPLLVLVALVAALLCRALGPELLVNPWNPWVPVLPFLLYVLLAWSLAERDWVALPWLVGIGSFVVQTHLGYAPLVVALGVVAGVLAVVARPRTSPAGNVDDPAASDEVSRLPARRWLAIAGIVGALLWLAPLVQQVTGSPGNLSDIYQYFRNPTERFAGWSVGFGIMANELKLVGPWVTGNDAAGPFALVPTASTIPALALLAVTGGLGALAWHRGARSAGRLAALAVVAASIGVVAVSRVTGLVAPYLVRWAWVVAALVWLSLAWSLWSLLPRTRVVRGVLAGALAAAVALSVVTVWKAATVDAPDAMLSRAVAELAPDTIAHLDGRRTYLVRAADSHDLGAAAVGVFLELSQRGVSVRFGSAFTHAFGSWRTARPSEVDGVLVVVTGDTAEAGGAPPPDGQRVAHYDPLTPRERDRARRLERRVRAAVGSDASSEPALIRTAAGRAILRRDGADERSVEQLWQLVRRGDAYTVYLTPPRA